MSKIRKVSMRLVFVVGLCAMASWSQAQTPSTTQTVVSISPGSLRNGSFESWEDHIPRKPGGPIGARPWDLLALGSLPDTARDTLIVHDGRQSVRLSASELTLAALDQEILVQGGRSYCLQGYARTEKLTPSGRADMLGTICVLTQVNTAENWLLTGANLPGTRDWTGMRLYFTAPADGKLHIMCSLCGEGNARGKAWFDSLQLQPISARCSEVEVLSTPSAGPPPAPLAYTPYLLSELCQPAAWSQWTLRNGLQPIGPWHAMRKSKPLWPASFAQPIAAVLKEAPAAWPLELGPVPEHLTIQAAWNRQRSQLVLTAINHDDTLDFVKINLAATTFKVQQILVSTCPMPTWGGTVVLESWSGDGHSQWRVPATSTITLPLPPHTLVRATCRSRIPSVLE